MTDQIGFVSYVELILDVLAADSRRPLFITADGQEVAAGRFRDSVHQVAAEFVARGVRRGSTVSVISGNRPEALAARYAANLLGARVVFLYLGMAAEPLARITGHVETEVLLVDPAACRTAEEVLALVDVPTVLTVGPCPMGEDLMACAARREPLPVASVASPEDDWCIRYTGGTTGIPKGVRSSHGMYARALRRFADSGSDMRFLACTTIAHFAGMLADATLAAGGTVVLQNDFDAGRVLAAVERERITDLWLLPPLLYQLLDHPALAGTDLSSLRRIIYGGSASSPTRLRQAVEVFGPVLFGGYGQSEAGQISTLRPHEHEGAKLATVGRAVSGVRIEIRDQAGEVLPAGEVGEIYVHSAQAMTGYWKQPELTARVLRDGWVRTGDVGCLDAENYLSIVDRVKDMIVVVGGHVYTAELEDLLLNHPGVAQCAVFGVRAPDASEQVQVAIVPAPGHVVDHVRIRDFVIRHKGAMYAPTVVHLVEHIPLTPAGKPDKEVLRKELIASGY